MTGLGWWSTKNNARNWIFDPTNKWYMHSPESVQENKAHKPLWDFEIQTDKEISAKRTDLVTVKKKEGTCRIVDFAVPADHRRKLKENEKRDKYLDLARELKRPWNMKMTVIPIVIRALGKIPKGLIKQLEDLEIRGRQETINTSVASFLKSSQVWVSGRS